VIDGYSIQARLTPVLIGALPLILLGMVALPSLAVVERVTALLLIIMLCPLFDQLGRTGGRRCQSRIFSAWGGAPTTQSLRWRGTGNAALQHRRHQAVERLVLMRLPAPAEEAADPVGSDRIYEAAVGALRVLTAHSRVLRAENRSYGFRRNLYGLRPWGCLVTVVSMAILGLWAWRSPTASTHLPAAAILGGLDLVQAALWVTLVRESWVREAAWAYAECLIGQVDRLDTEQQDWERLRTLAPRKLVGGGSGGQPPDPPPTVAVMTALACEFAAVTTVLQQDRPLTGGVAGDPNLYRAGEFPSRRPGQAHQVVATVLPYDGSRSAAAVVTDVLRSFPTIRCVIFCGIAGGIPSSGGPGADVRLGDVLVAVDGVVDYDHTYLVDGEARLRRQLQGISADMLRAVQELRAIRPDLSRTLEREMGEISDPRFARPDGPGGPEVHFGAIGSADRLVRDLALRDRLASRYDVMGLEMEASGLAVGASLRGVPWFVVRGVSDHCNNLKNDSWHGYASLAAAAFVAMLLGHAPPLREDQV
jgi:nucleoside phosphorylase